MLAGIFWVFQVLSITSFSQIQNNELESHWAQNLSSKTRRVFEFQVACSSTSKYLLCPLHDAFADDDDVFDDDDAFVDLIHL